MATGSLPRRSAVAALLAALVLAAEVHGQAVPDAVTVRPVAARSTVRPGDQLVIAVVLQHNPGFHTWPHDPVLPPALSSVRPIATTIVVVTLPEGAELRPIQWPEPSPVRVSYTRSPVDLLSYVDTAVAYVPLDLAADQPLGTTVVELSVRYQACDETYCYFPKTETLEVPFQIVAADADVTVELTEPALFAAFGREAFGGGGSTIPSVQPILMNVFGWSFALDPGGPEGIALLLLLAALGGLVLNFTPCVLPVIPIKILGLSRAAGDPSRLLRLGGVMSLGVVAFWIALGGAIAFVSGFDAISSLFQTGWFAPVVGIVVAVMAGGMLGLLSVRLPQFVYKIDSSQETVAGSFGFGVMTAVLSTPCTAPFMAGASAWAAMQKSATTLATFAAIGVGMALPYLLLSARPGLVQKVPRTGPASVLVKQVMGLLMLAVAAFFLGSAFSAWLQQPPEPASRTYWWAVVAFVLAACGWVGYRVFAVTPSTVKRAVVSAIALGLAVTNVLLARNLSGHGSIDWTYYTADRFTQAAADEDVIVLDFTAEWCLNCKALEAGVLHRPEIVELLGSPGVVPMRVDLTADNPVGKAKLAELNWVGIPLLAVYGPGIGYDAPQKFDSYTPSMVKDAVARARPAGEGSGR